MLESKSLKGLVKLNENTPNDSINFNKLQLVSCSTPNPLITCKLNKLFTETSLINTQRFTDINDAAYCFDLSRHKSSSSHPHHDSEETTRRMQSCGWFCSSDLFDSCLHLQDLLAYLFNARTTETHWHLTPNPPLNLPHWSLWPHKFGIIHCSLSILASSSRISTIYTPIPPS